MRDPLVGYEGRYTYRRATLDLYGDSVVVQLDFDVETLIQNNLQSVCPSNSGESARASGESVSLSDVAERHGLEANCLELQFRPHLQKSLSTSRTLSSPSVHVSCVFVSLYESNGNLVAPGKKARLAPIASAHLSSYFKAHFRGRKRHVDL